MVTAGIFLQYLVIFLKDVYSFVFFVVKWMIAQNISRLIAYCLFR